MKNTVETIKQHIKERDRIRVALLKELADSIGELRDELLASYKMIEFSTDDMLKFFNDFIKSQELFEKLANNYVSMGWFSFYDAPKGWFEDVACLRMITCDESDDIVLKQCVEQVIACYLKFISALLEVEA